MLKLNAACLLMATLIALMPSDIGATSRAGPQLAREASAPPEERGSVALDQALRDLSNPFTVMSVASRPGGSDHGALAYYRKSLGARTVMLFATRGESGDSADCSDGNRELGFIRTREAIESARVLGADVYFLNLPDFGFAKSADQALSVWGHPEALGKLVSAIRSLRPDVIITSLKPNTGDGKQQAVARLTREAILEAANAKQAAEVGSEPWRVKRLFEKSDPAIADVIVGLNRQDTARGRSYAEIGLAARKRFLSVSPVPERILADEEASSYKLAASVEGDTVERGGTLLSGLTLSEKASLSIAPPRVGDLPLTEAVTRRAELFEALRQKLLEKRAEGSIEDIRVRYGIDYHRVVGFISALERALALSLGLGFEVTAADRILTPGQKLTARVEFRNGSGRPIPFVLRMPETLPGEDVKPAYKQFDPRWVPAYDSAFQEAEYEISSVSAFTMPRTGHLHREQYYPVGSSLPGALPLEPFGNSLIVSAEVGLDNVSIPLAALARYDVAPRVEISTTPFVVLKDWSKPREVDVVVRARNRTDGALSGSLWVVPLALTDDNYEPTRLSFAREDEEVAVKIKLRLPILKPPLAPDVLLELRRDGPSSSEPLGLATIPVKVVSFETPEQLKVGYIASGGQWLAHALDQLDVSWHEIKIDELATAERGAAANNTASCGDLARFDTIVVDRCAYFMRPELISRNSCLLSYVNQGGNLVVLDQRPDDWNLVLSRSQFAPYQLKLSNDRIAFPAARVNILEPEHALMSRPNKITERDFDGWQAERAVNIPREWASQYTPLLESSDPGEPSKRGGLLVARVGAGSYIFTSFNWRRELLSMNPGAYRVFVNLISLPKTNSRPRRITPERQPARTNQL